MSHLEHDRFWEGFLFQEAGGLPGTLAHPTCSARPKKPRAACSCRLRWWCCAGQPCSEAVCWLRGEAQTSLQSSEPCAPLCGLLRLAFEQCHVVMSPKARRKVGDDRLISAFKEPPSVRTRCRIRHVRPWSSLPSAGASPKALRSKRR